MVMYTSTVYFNSKIHHKAYEFVRRLLSNIHGRMRKPSVPSACTYVNLYRNLIHNCLRVMTSDTAQQQREDMGVSMQARWSDGGFNSA